MTSTIVICALATLLLVWVVVFIRWMAERVEFMKAATGALAKSFAGAIKRLDSVTDDFAVTKDNIVRTLHINDEAWSYQVSENYVKVYAPNGKGKAWTHSEILDISQADIERGHWKGGHPDDIGVTPGKLKAYIQKNLKAFE